MTKIAIFSDSHDQVWHLMTALEQARDLGAEVLLHCGDMNAPFIVGLLARHFSGPIHLIFGNNEGDGRLIQTQAAKYPQVTHHGDYAELTLGDRRIAMIHYPAPARRLAQSQQFDLVCYGHDHTRHREALGQTLLVNPGEILGLKHPPTWGLYDTETHEFTWVEIPTPLQPLFRK